MVLFSYLSLFPLSPLVSCHHHPFREKKQRETREAVSAHSAGLGHPDEETQQSIRNCKETEIPSSKDVERLPSHSFSLLIIQPFLSDLTEVFFARLMHSTSIIR